ncbi:MAG: Uma2 family endonuclease [Chloroflexi bacterium]|nr:Uma2 family endonuclease [Chloroflexota bacterium]
MAHSPTAAGQADALLARLPVGHELHQQVSITRGLTAAWMPAPVSSEPIASDPEPDAAAFLGSDDRPPVLVVEIADTSLALDQGDKLTFYASARIPADWVLDLNAQLLHAYDSPSGDMYSGHCQMTTAEAAVLPWPAAPVPVRDLLP